MNSILHRTLGRKPPLVANGKGVFLNDREGRTYLDACGGAAVSCLGHGDGEIAAAVFAQMRDVAYVHSSFFTSQATELLGDRLVGLCGPWARSALFFSSGSESMEAALKLARQYHLERGEPHRVHVIGRTLSYHGATLGALGFGGLENRKVAFAPWFSNDHRSLVQTCYPYRYKRPDETDAEYGGRLAAELELEIQRVGAARIAAFVAETVAGATIGAVPPVDGYFRHVRDICNRHGIILILDEIMCGMGRCGSWLACHDEGVEPDIVCVAKGLGGGFQPVGAMVVSSRVHSVLEAGSRSFMHGQTYMGHATVCAAALAVIEKLDRLKLVRRVADRGPVLGQLLREALGGHAHVGDIRGRGFFWAVEFVEDRATKQPFNSGGAVATRIKAAAMEKGLLCYPGGGNLPGGCGDHILLSPPFITSDEQLEQIAAKLKDAIHQVFAKGTPP